MEVEDEDAGFNFTLQWCALTPDVRDSSSAADARVRRIRFRGFVGVTAPTRVTYGVIDDGAICGHKCSLTMRLLLLLQQRQTDRQTQFGF